MAQLVPILAHPYNRGGPNRRYVDGLSAALREVNLEPRVVWDRDERAALLADPRLGETCRCVVSAGGDGSLGDVVNELKADVPVAMLPLGNENLFARQFGYDRDGDKLAAAIARGATRAMDAGVTGDRLFTLMVSAGFDGEVVRRVDRWRASRPGMRRVNRTSYLPRIIGAVRAYDYPPITLEADGRRVTAAHVFAFNLPQYGMGLGIMPDAREADGLLHWIAFQKPGLVQLGAYALSVYRKRHVRRDDVFHGRARHVRITADAPVPVQADGDPAGMTPTDITIRPKALRVIAMD